MTTSRLKGVNLARKFAKPVWVTMPKSKSDGVVKDVSFVRCDMEGLAPCQILAPEAAVPPENIVFTDCRFRLIRRVKQRHSPRADAGMLTDHPNLSAPLDIVGPAVNCRFDDAEYAAPPGWGAMRVFYALFSQPGETTS